MQVLPKNYGIIKSSQIKSKHSLVKSVFAILAIVGFFIITSSCDSHIAFQQNKKIHGEAWHKDSIVEFSFNVKDTTQLYDIFLNLRHSTQYEYRNFYLFFETIMPDGRVVRDTLECILADRSGKWLGKGFGRVKSNSFHFRENVWFPRKGYYLFRLEQAMREEILEGIIDVGIRIEKK